MFEVGNEYRFPVPALLRNDAGYAKIADILRKVDTLTVLQFLGSEDVFGFFVYEGITVRLNRTDAGVYFAASKDDIPSQETLLHLREYIEAALVAAQNAPIVQNLTEDEANALMRAKIMRTPRSLTDMMRQADSAFPLTEEEYKKIANRQSHAVTISTEDFKVGEEFTQRTATESSGGAAAGLLVVCAVMLFRYGANNRSDVLIFLLVLAVIIAFLFIYIRLQPKIIKEPIYVSREHGLTYKRKTWHWDKITLVQNIRDDCYRICAGERTVALVPFRMSNAAHLYEIIQSKNIPIVDVKK